MTNPMLEIGIKRMPHAEGLTVVHLATEGSSGYDLIAAIENSLTLKCGERILVPCGFMVEMPKGVEAQVRPRSGLSLHHGVTVLNSPGTIDSDYRGEIKVILINHGQKDFIINRGDRIAQMVFARIEQPQFTEVKNQEIATARGAQGFGSTGIGMGREKSAL